MIRRTLLVVPLLVVGCASARPTAAPSPTGATNQAAVTKAAPGTRVVCKYEKITGSNIPERICYRVLDDLERDHSRDAAIDTLNKPQTQMKAGH